MSRPLSVASSGLVCSVGHDSLEVYASVRAGAARFQRTHLIGQAGPIVAAPALPISPDCEGLERAHALSEQAFRSALEPFSARLNGAKVGLVVTASSLGFADAKVLPPFIAEHLCSLRQAWSQIPMLAKIVLENAGCIIPERALCFVREGHAGGLMGIRMASELAVRFALDLILVVSIASHCERFQLETLDGFGLARSEASSEGWVPSEAAAVLVLEPASAKTVHAVAAFAREAPGDRLETRGVALGTAIERALDDSGVRATDIAEVWSDQNGERWRAHEWAHGATRSLGVYGASPPVVHPADVLGDLGGAMGTTLAILGSLAARELDRPVLVTASSHRRFRSAAVIHPPGRRGKEP